jgi:hypothetical protein
MATLQLRHEHGDFALTFTGFRDRLRRTGAARDPALVRDAACCSPPRAVAAGSGYGFGLRLRPLAYVAATYARLVPS